MALRLAISNRAWNEQPIRLPDGDNMTDDNDEENETLYSNDSTRSDRPNPPFPPNNEHLDDNDDGTCLIDLLQRRDPLADILIRLNLTSQNEVVASSGACGNEENNIILNYLSLLFAKDKNELSLLLSHGLPLHSILLSNSSQGNELLSKVNNNNEIDLSSENLNIYETSSTLTEKLPSILNEAYGGIGYRSKTRLHLLNIYNNSIQYDGKIKCGNEEYKIHKFILAHRSDFLKASLNHSSSSSNVDSNEKIENISKIQTIEMPNEFISTPGLFNLILKYIYTLHQIELNDLLANADSIVEVAYCADLLMLPDLKEAALKLACEAVDNANAPSLLHVAQNLNHDLLRRKCIGHMMKHLGEVARSAPHFHQVIGAKEYDWLQRLAEASVSNPIACGAILTDEREYIAMLSEALDQQRIQFVESKSRHLEEIQEFELTQVKASQEAEYKAINHYQQPDSIFHQISKRLKLEVESRRSRFKIVDDYLLKQSKHIEFLDEFLKTANNAAAQAAMHNTRKREENDDKSSNKTTFKDNINSLDNKGGVHSRGLQLKSSRAAEENDDIHMSDIHHDEYNINPGEFIPTYEWQNIKENQVIPAGLDIRVNINAGFGGGGGSGTDTHGTDHDHARRARIPPVWRLKVWIEWMKEIYEEDDSDENDDGVVGSISSSSSLAASSSSSSSTASKMDRYHRQDVRRDDLTGSVESSIARMENVDINQVKLIIYDPKTKKEFHLHPSTTFEPYFFIHQRELRVVINAKEETFPLVKFIKVENDEKGKGNMEEGIFIPVVSDTDADDANEEEEDIP